MICVLLVLAAFVGGVAASSRLRSWWNRQFPPRPPAGGAGNG